MLTLLIIGATVLLTGSGVVVWMRAAPGRACRPDPRVPTVFSLLPGDIVQYTGTDYVVDSTIRYEQDGVGWQEHLLDGGDGDRWLVVEEDDRVVLALVEVVDDPATFCRRHRSTASRPSRFADSRTSCGRRGGRARRGSCRGTGTAQTAGVDFSATKPDGQCPVFFFFSLVPPADALGPPRPAAPGRPPHPPPPHLRPPLPPSEPENRVVFFFRHGKRGR